MTKIDPTKQPGVRIEGGDEIYPVTNIDYKWKEVWVLVDTAEEHRYKFDQVEFVTDEPDKVSDCCGAEINWRWKSVPEQNSWPFCKSCGEPCEAVEDKTLSEKHRECVVDDKPDPIEPLSDDVLNFSQPLVNQHIFDKQKEIINWLLEQHD